MKVMKRKYVKNVYLSIVAAKTVKEENIIMAAWQNGIESRQLNNIS